MVQETAQLCMRDSQWGRILVVVVRSGIVNGYLVLFFRRRRPGAAVEAWEWLLTEVY